MTSISKTKRMEISNSHSFWWRVRASLVSKLLKDTLVSTKKSYRIKTHRKFRKRVRNRAKLIARANLSRKSRKASLSSQSKLPWTLLAILTASRLWKDLPSSTWIIWSRNTCSLNERESMWCQIRSRRSLASFWNSRRQSKNGINKTSSVRNRKGRGNKALTITRKMTNRGRSQLSPQRFG